jgi:oligosaccharide repeat unit polymerase
MRESLFFASCVDITVLLMSSWLLFRSGKISIYHPATTYLVFHLFAFTTRLLFLTSGATFFLGGQLDYFTEIESHEIVKAALLADLGFISMTIAWLLESSRKLPLKTSKSLVIIDENVLKLVLFVTVPLGIWGIFSQLYIPGIGKAQLNFGDWSNSSYLQNTQNFLILSMLILVFKYGFQKYSLIIIGICLFILAFQGQHRYRVLVPCIFLLFLYLYREQKKWLSLRFVMMILVGIMIFLPMKYVGKLIQQGASTDDLIEFAAEYRESLDIGANADFSFLDMYASTLTLIDQKGKYYYGSTYLNLLLIPIPRPFWQDKPSLVQWITDVSTSSRNLKELGAIPTIYGEAYVNFGYLGIIFIPFLFAKYSARWYYKILNTHPQSVNLYLYLYFSAIIIQVYRDGLNAIFIFLSAYNMPGFFVYIFSIIKQKRA